MRVLLPREDADEIDGLIYEKGGRIKGTRDRYRLTLRPKDADFFQSYVQRPGGVQQLEAVATANLSDPRRNIRDNALTYLRGLTKCPAEQLSRLAQFAARRCYLVAVATPDLSSAYRIFSVLNSRGLNLTHSDILKADVIGELPEAEQESYTQKWEDWEEALGRDGFQDLFAHIRMIYRKAKLAGTVLDEYRKHILPTVDKAQFIDRVVLPYAEAYELIRTASYESSTGAEDVNELLRWLNEIDNFDWIPPAILFLSRNRNDSAALTKFFY